MQINSTLLSFLFPSATATDTGSAILSILQGARNGTTAAQVDPIAALADAERNSEKQIAAKSQEPLIKREVADFVEGVVNAKTVDELLADPKVMKVLLAANGLEEFVNAKGLYTKALKSDPADPDGLAVRLAETNAAWLEAAQTYQFATKGLAVIQAKDTITTLAQGYAEVRWREGLDAKAPGVSAALTFKDIAATLDSPFKILGNGVAREVVTTALGLPLELAYQSLEAQSKAVTARLDIDRLKDPAYVDMFARRYLIALNSSGGGLTV